jgi:ankyrin repeat protein
LAWWAVGFGQSYIPPALHEAARRGDMSQVRNLVESGTDPNLLDDNKKTALQHAVENQHFGVAEYLLRRGGTLDLKSTRGLTGRDEILSRDYSHLPAKKRPDNWIYDVYDNSE